jgi:hypothetical protein
MRVEKKGDWMGGYTLPSTMALPLAYKLTGDQRYRDYHALECDYYLGGNPLNMTWLTGLAEKSPTDLLHVEARRRWGPQGLPTPEGIVPYGPAAYSHSSQGWCAVTATAQNTCYPAYSNWSIAELWFEWPAIVCNNEYTVHQMQGPAIFAYSALCDDAVSRDWPKPTTSVRADRPVTTLDLQALEQVSISPQSGVLHIKAPQAVRVELYDVSGRRLVRRAPATLHALPLGSLTPGPYMVTVKGARVQQEAFVWMER